MVTLHKAQRTRAKLRVGLSGPSGSGKTLSALLLARGLTDNWDKICIIDTENGSGELYANHSVKMEDGSLYTIGEYNVITLKEFKPSDYMWAIKACEEAQMEVVIVDSITHEWKYILEAVDKMTNGAKNFAAWGKATPMHDMFVQSILKSTCHVITTVRSKQDYDMSKDEKTGKSVVTKLGLKPETREGFEYELTVSLDIDIKHFASISKDRTGELLKMYDLLPFHISEETGKTIRAWYDSAAEAIIPAKEEKKENDIVNIATPESAPPLKVTEVKQEELPPPKDGKLTVAERESIVNQWSVVYQMMVEIDGVLPADERINMINEIQNLPHIAEQERKIKSSIDLRKSDHKIILQKFLSLTTEYRKLVKEKMSKTTDNPHKETGYDAAGEAKKMFWDDDTTTNPPTVWAPQ